MGNKLTLNITEDIIQLIKLLIPTQLSDAHVGYDTYALFTESHPFDLIAMALGLEDKKIKGTEENPMGAEYDEETTERIQRVYSFFVDNLVYLEEILHQFCDVGIKVGKYSCLTYNRLWKYEG